MGTAAREPRRPGFGDPPEVLFYLGRNCSGATPAGAALVLQDDGELCARERTTALALPERVGLVPCGGARQRSGEWLGLAPAPLVGGARVVFAALWKLVWRPPGELVPTRPTRWCSRSSPASASPTSALAWRCCQLNQLAAWRAGERKVEVDHAPLYWAGIAPVGFVTGGAGVCGGT